MTSSPTESSLWRERVGPLTLRAWLLIALALAVVLRLVAIHNHSLEYDDGATLDCIALPVRELIVERFARGHLPHFFLFMRGWVQLFGESLLCLRLPSAALSLLGFPVVMVLANRIGGPRAALASLVVALLHSGLLFHGLTLRMYAWQLTVGGLLIVLLLRMLVNPTVPAIVLCAAVHWFFLQLHVGAPLFTVVLFASMGILSISRGRSRRWWVGFAAALLAPLALTVPELLYMKNHLDMRQYEKFLEFDPGKQAVVNCFELVFGHGGGADEIRMAMAFLFPLAGWALAAGWFQKNPAAPEREESPAGLSRNRVALLCALAGFGPVLLALVVSLAGKPIIGYARYYNYGTLPLIALIAAGAGTVRWERAWARRVVLAVFLACAAVYLDESWSRGRDIVLRKPRSLGSLALDMKKTLRPDSRLILSGSVTIVKYYLRPELDPPALVVDHRDDVTETRRRLAEFIGAADDVYLLVYRRGESMGSIVDFIQHDLGPWDSVDRRGEKRTFCLHFQRAARGNDAPAATPSTP